jgi:hypothetical protein
MVAAGIRPELKGVLFHPPAPDRSHRPDIDRLVVELYGLTEAEIGMVEGQRQT